MSRSDRSSIAERLMVTAAALAVAAVAASFAVHIIESVWVPLILIVIGSALLAAGVLWCRRNSRGW